MVFGQRACALCQCAKAKPLDTDRRGHDEQAITFAVGANIGGAFTITVGSTDQSSKTGEVSRAGRPHDTVNRSNDCADARSGDGDAAWDCGSNCRSDARPRSAHASGRATLAHTRSDAGFTRGRCSR